jgi:hypothetical protein
VSCSPLTATRVSHPPGPGASPRIRKGPSLLGFPGRWAMASALLASAFAMIGCVIPQDYRFSDDPPPFKNNPVTIKPPPFPAALTLSTNNGQPGGRGCAVEFSVLVTDPDLDDLLTVQWFVDYDPETNPRYYREEPLNNTGTPERGPAELVIDLNAIGNPLENTGGHVVEFLVGDGQIVNRIPQPKSRDADAGVNPSYVDRYVWIVNVDTGECPL